MFGLLFLFFLFLPFLEIWLLFHVAKALGLSGTFFLVFITAALGTIFVRQQGFATLRRIQQQMRSGEVPTEALVDGVFILMAGVLLMTPGVLTDAVGFAFLAPFARRFVAKIAKSVLANRFQGNFRVSTLNGRSTFISAGSQPGPRDAHGGIVIEAKNVRVRDSDEADQD